MDRPAPQQPQLDRYVIQDYLAEGGMGAIYLGKKLGMGGFEKEVVLKQLLPEFVQQPEFIDLFLREAKLSASLDHQNIVHTIDLVNANDDFFIVMEYVRGADLRSVLKRVKRRGKMLKPHAALFIGREICAALAYAHAKLGPDGKPLGLIHRDISPSNILLSASGEVKLTDFGIAKASTHRSVFYRVKGKVGYMSPEQAKGETIDHRSDLYSLAVCLYEAMTGEKLFIADLTTSAERLYAEPIPRVSQKRSGMPPELDDVLRRALAVRPQDRYQSAHDFGDALLRVAHRNGLMFSSPDLASQLRESCGEDVKQWMTSDEVAGEGGDAPPGTELYMPNEPKSSVSRMTGMQLTSMGAFQPRGASLTGLFEISDDHTNALTMARARKTESGSEVFDISDADIEPASDPRFQAQGVDPAVFDKETRALSLQEMGALAPMAAGRTPPMDERPSGKRQAFAEGVGAAAQVTRAARPGARGGREPPSGPSGRRDQSPPRARLDPPRPPSSPPQPERRISRPPPPPTEPSVIAEGAETIARPLPPMALTPPPPMQSARAKRPARSSRVLAVVILAGAVAGGAFTGATVGAEPDEVRTALDEPGPGKSEPGKAEPGGAEPGKAEPKAAAKEPSEPAGKEAPKEEPRVKVETLPKEPGAKEPAGKARVEPLEDGKPKVEEQRPPGEERRTEEPTSELPTTASLGAKKGSRLVVESSPSEALVRVGGRTVCKTPCELKQVPRDAVQRVRVEKPGYQAWTALFDLKGKASDQLTAFLKPEAAGRDWGYVTILGGPTGAVYLDGRETGAVSSDPRIPVRPGAHSLSVVRPGAPTRPSVKIHVRAGEEVKVSGPGRR